jgi:hypothetical protein
VEARLKEHQRYNGLEHPEKSAVAEHSVDLGHRIQFHNTFILATKNQYMDRIVREAIEVRAPSEQYEQRDGFLSQKFMEANPLLPQET